MTCTTFIGLRSMACDLRYLLDYRNEDRPEWVTIPIGKGPTPGKR